MNSVLAAKIRLQVLLSAMLLALSIGQVHAQNQDGFDEKTVLDEAEEFFGEGAEGLADVVKKAFEDYGRPNAYIKGEEVSGAVGVGVFYGEGDITMATGESRKVYWQGPTIGFDLGAEAAKTFVLLYDLPDIDSLFKRYPGVSGSLYFVAGVGMNYARRDDTVVAPIRFGVGWRRGANIGYIHFTPEKKMLPL
ncbi:MAG: DUF1134 domain-containing protein [Gammaproteobacteria bacterium]|nr:DUF1134 domain-containing protein [Gammaproteobacteria bacterium]